MSAHMNFPFFVDNTLLKNRVSVLRYAVGVVTSPGKLIQISSHSESGAIRFSLLWYFFGPSFLIGYFSTYRHFPFGHEEDGVCSLWHNCYDSLS